MMLEGWYMMAREEGKYRAIGGHRANAYGEDHGFDACSVCGRRVRRDDNTRSGWRHLSVRSSHSTRTIPAVTEYFSKHHPEYRETPVIHETFTPEEGWVKYPFRKKVSRSWLRKLRAFGVTRVALAVGPYDYIVADFSIRELLK